MGRHGTLQAIVLCLAALGQAGPTVTVLNGTYEGYRLDALDQDVFLGMPYAQPPLSVFRFREPQSLNESWNTVKPATQYGAVCYQYPFPVDYAPMSEDCLTINVVRPSGVPSCTKLPVAVWIHGGGLYAGGSASPSYNLTNFVYQSTLAGKPVLGVSINYRLTAFGFLWGSPELTARGSANNGLRDQRMALQWIQENIRAFGGDPSKVTIWGESSGALSVGKHLIAYGGRDDSLFRGAIMQSGGMAEKWPYNINNATAYTEDLYRNLTETTGCNTEASPLECLRSLPIEQMSAALNISGTPVYSGAGLGPWLTVVDGDFLADGPSESLADRHFNHNVTILYTTLTDEISSGLVGAKVDTDADFAALVASAGADEATVRTIEILYPNINAVGLPAGFEPTAEDDATLGSQYKRAVAFSTDAIETSSRRLTVDTWAAAGLTAYSGRPNLKALGASPAAGAFHSADVAFVFNNVAGSQYENPQLQAISVLMSRMWASFVSDLDPNNHGMTGYPTWPTWNTTNVNGVGTNFVFDADGSNDTSSHLELDDFRLAQTRYINTIWESQLNY